MNKDMYKRVSEQFAGGADMIKSTPLVSFECLVDTDIGVIRYCLNEFPNPTYFNLEKMNKLNKLELIGLEYKRKEKNPLLVASNDNLLDQDKEFLDECYKEIIETKYQDVLSYSYYTQFVELIKLFKDSGDINPTILYNNEYQKEIIENHPIMKQFPIVSMSEINSGDINPDMFSQFYFRYLDEAIPFTSMKLTGKTLYFSTSGLNLNEENNDLIDHQVIQDCIHYGNLVSIVDMYRMDIIGRY